MKKLLITASIIAAALLGLFYAGKITGALRLYSCPSGANEPAFKAGSHFFASTFKKPERFDFIIFERDNPDMSGTKELIFHRLCGMPGDKVELKDGVLYVNDANTDSHLNTMKDYVVTLQQEIALIRQLEPGTEDLDPAVPVSIDWGDSLLANLSTEYVKQNHLRCRVYMENNMGAAEYITKKWGSPWSMDNFGPLIVPKDSFFLLGDNRHNAYDSRFIGFIPQSSFKGTVLH